MKMQLTPSGLLLLNKEPGVTSFEALEPVKRAAGSGKAGHTGTLDKFASGLLIILLGKALKLTPWFTSCNKEYEAVIRFGTETDTLDPEGAAIAQAPLPSLEKVLEILPQFTGEIMQAPPAYSAIHINGKRAHELARSGKNPEMKKRPITVHSIKIENWSPPFASIRVNCSSGTYIRSLARDLATASGSRGYLASLCRTRIAGFSLKNACKINFEDNENLGNENGLSSAIKPISPEIFDLLGIPSFIVEADDEAKISCGKPLDFLESRLPKYPVLGLFLSGGKELAAVIERKNNRWHYGHVANTKQKLGKTSNLI